MIFYVYLDPEVISVANNHGPYALQSLISILRGFLQNCFITEFEDYRIQSAIKTFVNNMPDIFDRKVIKRLLEILAKRNRFIYCLIPDYAESKDDLTCVLEQATSVFLDLLLLKETDNTMAIPARLETTTLASYQHTNFEHERSLLASHGRTFREGALDENKFLDQILGKALRFATRIEVCDKLFERKFGENYEYTVKTMLRWLERILADPGHCKLVFHCGKPEGYGDDYIKTQLASFRRGRLSELAIEIQFYDLPNPDRCLPHERFILTDQIAMEIGRGMDFLDKNTHKNRDVSIGYKSLEEVEALLKSYSPGRLPIVSV